MAALLRRTRNLSLRQLRLLHSVATGGLGCAPLLLESAASGGGLPPAGARPTQLWLYDSPLLRHLSTAAVQDAEVRKQQGWLMDAVHAGWQLAMALTCRR